MKRLEITNYSGKRVQMIEINRITPNQRQPRKSFNTRELFSLADSIHRYGILQPLSVRKRADEEGYELVSGERRLRAADLLKMPRVPCIVVNADERTSAVMAIVENIQRSDLNLFEEAEAISTLKEMYSMTQEDIASTLSVSQSYVANKLRILRLDTTHRRLILDNSLTERHCRSLIRLTDSEEQRAALEHIIKHSLNVAQTEEYIDKLLSSKPRAPIPKKTKTLKDVRIFYNSIDRAIKTVRNYGIDVVSEIKERDDCTEINIIVQGKGFTLHP